MGLLSLLFGKASAPRTAPPQQRPHWATQALTPGSRPAVVPKPDRPDAYLHQATSGALWGAPVDGFRRPVVGESRYQEALLEICGGYARDGHTVLCDATLIPEPDNPHDANAVRVEIAGRPVGYLAAADAGKYAGQLAKLGLAGRAVTVRAKIVGGARSNQHDLRHFGVWLAFNWPLRVEGV